MEAEKLRNWEVRDYACFLVKMVMRLCIMHAFLVFLFMLSFVKLVASILLELFNDD